MADRYWVGGSGTWNTTSTTNWSASSGGGSGASVPTVADSVFFDQAGTYTVTCTGALTSLDFTVSAGTVTFATGTSPSFNIRGSLSLLAGTVWNPTSTITFSATTTGKTVTTNGTILAGSVTFNGSGGGWTLGSALTIGSTATISINQGTFNTANYAITCGVFNSNSTSTRTLNLGSSTITFGVAVSGGIFNIANNAGLTFNAGTSTFTSAQSSATFAGGGVTFYNLTLSNTTTSSIWSITGANTFNDLTIPGKTTLGIRSVSFGANQTINGTLSLGASTGAPYRTFLSSTVVGTQRTLTCAAISSVTDVDFADINFAGAISLPVTGTRLGDCKGNNNITFPAAKTVYYRQPGTSNWGTATNGSWSATSGGAFDATMFPLAQDTAIFPATAYPPSISTTTINAPYNIGTIDMSLRTSNTMTLANGTNAPTIYGNWINGTGITLSGSGRISFSGQTTQTITSAGRNFSQPFTIETGSGSVTLQDALSTSVTSTAAIFLTSGTFDANGYNVTASSTGATAVNISGTATRTLAIGSGTWTIAGTTGWSAGTTTNLTVTGTGTISLTSASAKTFTGGSFSYSGITLNQGGAGDLTITGSNTFGDITNTVQPASVLFTAGTTSTFSNFSLSGTAGNLITIGSVTAASHTLSKTLGVVAVSYCSISRSTATGGATWNALNSTNGGNNSGWNFLGSGYIVIANNGTYSVSGQAATILRSKALSGDYGAYTLTGQTAELLRNKALSGDYGSYAVTGQDATLQRSKVLSGDYGSYAVTGQNASLLRSKVLSGGSGAYALTGQTASLLRSKALSGDFGSYTVAGQNASILRSKALSGDFGSYAVAGQTASLLRTRVLLGNFGAYTITGVNASIQKGKVLLGEFGSYTTVGVDASIQRTRLFDANTGQYALSGQDALITLGGTPIVVDEQLLIKLRSFTERRRF